MEKYKNSIIIVGLLGLIGINVLYYAQNFNANQQMHTVLQAMGDNLTQSAEVLSVM